MDKIASIFKSRRAYAVLTAIIVVVLHQGLGVDENTALVIAGSLVAWAVGDSVRKTE